jgi:diacylglycerol kinase family enzyme
VKYQSSKESNWRAALKGAADLVAVAGGDGTVNKVAHSLLGKDIPLAVLPCGIANNLARSLELIDVPLQQLVDSWQTARHLSFDMGIARGPWGQDTFLESLGAGLFAWTMTYFDKGAKGKKASAKEPKPGVLDARRFLRSRLQRFAPRPLQVTLDGRDLSGAFLLLEAMNIRSIGPNLRLAPQADPSDGLLDVAMVTTGERLALNDYLGKKPDDRRKAPPFTVHRGKHLRIQGIGAEFHLDDQPWPEKSDSGPYTLDVHVKRGAISFWVPDS